MNESTTTQKRSTPSDESRRPVAIQLVSIALLGLLAILTWLALGS